MNDLLMSKRLWATIATLVTIVSNAMSTKGFLDQTDIASIAGIVSAWLLGETYRPVTTAPPKE